MRVLQATSWVLAAAGITLAIGASLRHVKPRATASTDGATAPIQRIGDFKLTERSGRMMGVESFDGKVWVAEFFFTSCSGICPAQQRQMQRVQKAFAGEPDFRIAAFSVDPATDTPAALERYARQWKADPNRWLFFTGDKRMIYELARESFMVGIEQRPPTAPGGPDDFIHSDRFSLVDRNGQLVGSYHGTDPHEVDQLIADARRSLSGRRK